MSYYLYHTKEQGRPHILRSYATERGAKIGMAAANRNAGYQAYAIAEEEAFNAKYPVGMITVKNLMTGANVEIPEDTPWCCRPDSETFWSM